MPETLNLLFNGIYLSSIHSVQHRQYKSLANFRSFSPPRVGELVLQSREKPPPLRLFFNPVHSEITKLRY